MNIKQALDYIHGIQKFGSKPGLDAIWALTERLGRPQDRLRFVHVAGTNGKGSVCAYLSSILVQAGYRTGLFISPYFEVFNERIQVDGKNIADEKLCEWVHILKRKSDEMVRDGLRAPTEFETVTAMALLHFEQMQCDVVVWETGLGGRLDATNIVQNTECAVITALGFDHTDILGETLPEIAFEKAGIIKENCDVVVYPTQPDAFAVIEKTCRKKNAVLHAVDFDHVTIKKATLDGYDFLVNGYEQMRLPLLGEHQVYNAAVCIKTVEVLKKRGYSISNEAITRGFSSSKWPARAEVLCKRPLVIIDSGHNPQGAIALRTFLQQHFPEKKTIFVYGAYKDKDYEQISRMLFSDAKAVVTIGTKGERGLSAQALGKTVKKYCHTVFVRDTINEAVDECTRICGKDDRLVVFGSISFLAEIRNRLLSSFVNREN